MKNQDERIAAMSFSAVYPLYRAKVESKGRTAEELNMVICWLAGYDEATLQTYITGEVSFADFFAGAKLPEAAKLIKGTICGYRIEEIENLLTRQVRYLDKLVDELAKGKALDKILRS